MKSLYLFSILAMFYSCASEKHEAQFDTELVVAIDRTDKTIRPDAVEIIRLSGINENPWAGIKITITEITDVSTNLSKTFLIDGESEIQGYSELRTAKLLHLKKELTAYVRQFDTSLTREYSQISRSLGSICNYLSQSKARRRIVLLYSDCMENASINFYKPETMDLVRKSPEKVIAILERETPLKDLTGVRIYFQYKTKDFAQDLIYRTASSCFIKMYEKHHAQVYDAYSLD